MQTPEPLEIVARLEGQELTVCLPRPSSAELGPLRERMGDPSLSPGRRALLIQQYRVLEATTHKQEDEHDLLCAFLKQIQALQRDYLRNPADEAWADAPLGTLSANLGCSPASLAKVLKGRGLATGSSVVPLDDLVGVERFGHGKDLGYVQPAVLIPTDAMRSRPVIDELAEIYRDKRQFLLDPVLAVPHPTDGELAYVCEGNHRAAAAHLAKAKARVRLLRSKEAIQFYLSGSLAARLAASNTYAAFVSVCGERAQSLGYDAGSWDAYLAGASAEAAGAVRILSGAAECETTSDGLLVAIMELFEGLPDRSFSAKEVEERLLLMGVPRAALPPAERLELLLRASPRKLREASPGRFTLRA